MPVHVIGAEHDILVPIWKSEEIAALIAGSKLTVIEGAPHGCRSSERRSSTSWCSTSSLNTSLQRSRDAACRGYPGSHAVGRRDVSLRCLALAAPAFAPAPAPKIIAPGVAAGGVPSAGCRSRRPRWFSSRGWVRGCARPSRCGWGASGRGWGCATLRLKFAADRTARRAYRSGLKGELVVAPFVTYRRSAVRALRGRASGGACSCRPATRGCGSRCAG